MDVAVVELAVDVVLDHGDVLSGQHGHQAGLLVVGHLEAERVLEVRHHHARLHAFLVDQPRQRLLVDACDGIGRDLDGAHAQAFDRVQHGVVGR
ncbi:hypothetical protein D9M72_516430 [compost metagenome]